MRWLLDSLYLLIAGLTLPLWMTRMARTGKLRTDWAARFGKVEPLAPAAAPRILVHAVSVGEVNAVRLLIERLAGLEHRPEIVIATTTDTGYARAMSLFGGEHPVVRYPFDVSFAVDRFLNAVRPDVVALVELELWPNFSAACARRNIPLCIINGRLTRRSFDRYRWIRRIMRPSFSRLKIAAVQNEQYASRFAAMGTPPDRIHVTGTMKWDTAQIADDVPGASELAEQLGIDPERPLIVAGSTAPGEHELLVQAVPEHAQLLCAPRKPEWFDQAAAAMPGCARRSKHQRGSDTGRFLLDTIGELRQAYALADVVVIGRSFGRLHGSDMMEPIALGKATVVGPAVSDFQDTADALLAGDGMIQTEANELGKVLNELLADPNRRRQLAANGRAVIEANQGATVRHIELLQNVLKA